MTASVRGRILSRNEYLSRLVDMFGFGMLVGMLLTLWVLLVLGRI